MESVHNGEQQLELVERPPPIGLPAEAPNLQGCLDVEEECEYNL